MIQRPRLTLSGIVLDAPDAQAVAAFYRRLLGWTVVQDEPGRPQDDVRVYFDPAGHPFCLFLSD